MPARLRGGDAYLPTDPPETCPSCRRHGCTQQSRIAFLRPRRNKTYSEAGLKFLGFGHTFIKYPRVIQVLAQPRHAQGVHPCPTRAPQRAAAGDRHGGCARAATHSPQNAATDSPRLCSDHRVHTWPPWSTSHADLGRPAFDTWPVVSIPLHPHHASRALAQVSGEAGAPLKHNPRQHRSFQ
eukprot:scaffold188_cov107-Isochrysis_galbana.AAC.23